MIPSALELMDRHCLTAVNDWKNLGLEADSEAVLLGRLDAPGAAGDARGRCGARVLRGGRRDLGGPVRATRTRPTRCSPLVGWPTRPSSGSVRCSPRTSASRSRRCRRCCNGSKRSASEHDVLIANIAHAGDGNLHPLLITDPGDEAARIRAQQAFEVIITEALACGGTVTGEHGVGLLKMDGLAAELSPAVVEMHRAIRRALDPHRILNPGKVIAG